MTANHMGIGSLSRAKQSAGSTKTAAGGANYMLRVGVHRHAEDRVLAEGEANMPHWAESGRAYFEAEDRYHLRKNGRLITGIEKTLPLELSFEEQRELVERFCAEVAGDEKIPYVWAIHEGKGTNPHFHVQFSNKVNDGCEARPMYRWFRRANTKDPEKGGARSTDRFNKLNAKKDLRKVWEKCANEALAEAGLEVRIDMGSYRRRGIELLPQVKRGRSKEGLETGDDGRIWPRLAEEINEERHLKNARLILEKPERLLALYAHQRCITQPQLERELKSRFSHDLQAARQVRVQLDERLIDLGTDRRGNRLRATREQLCEHPELAVRALTQTRSTFAEADLADLFGDNEAGTRALVQVREHPDLVSVGAHPMGRPGPGGVQPYEERFTSGELIEAEQRLRQNVKALADEEGARIDPAHVDRAAIRRTLTGEQRQMLQALTGTDDSPRALTLVQGKPGTGKSYVVGALREAAEPQGVRVIGAAIAGVAAQGLGEDAGIDSYTVAKLTNKLRRGELDLKNTILVIDEAGMADVRALDELVKQARDAGVSRIAMIGDTAQLSPVGPGRPFEQLQRTYGAVELKDIQRQKVDWQREASVRMATGKAKDIAEGVGAYKDRGLVHEHATRELGLKAVARDWMEDVGARPDASRLMLAYLNEDVDRLNALARTALRDQGLLGKDHLFLDKTGAAHRFAVGDQVIFTAPVPQLSAPTGTAAEVLDIRDGRLYLAFKCRTTTVDAEVLGRRAEGVKPGDRFKLRGEVEGVGKAGERVEVLRVDRDQIRLRVYERKAGVSGAALAPHLKHGFARTTHRSQGATVDRTWLYANPNLNAEAAFVALTRHRQGTSLHYDEQAFEPPEGAGIGPPKGQRDQGTAYDRLLAALGKRESELTALEAFDSGDRTRVTDAAVYERRYLMARDDARRQALIRQLQSIAGSELTWAAAAAPHPAVRLAHTEHQQADRELAYANRRLRRLLSQPPRSSRFGANVRYHKQLADTVGEVKAAQRNEKAALEALKIVANHKDVREHAEKVLVRHRQQVSEAKKALASFPAIDEQKRFVDYARDYVERQNEQAGRQAMRLATRDDQGPEMHHRFIGLVEHQRRTLAVLEHHSGERLCVDATGHKMLEHLKPGERVGLNGRYLQKRNLQWYQQQAGFVLEEYGFNPTTTPHAIASDAKWEVTAVERKDDGLQLAILKDEKGQAAWYDLRLTHECHRLQIGDRLVIERSPQLEPKDEHSAVTRDKGAEQGAAPGEKTPERDKGRAAEPNQEKQPDAQARTNDAATGTSATPPGSKVSERSERKPSQRPTPRIRIIKPTPATEEGLEALQRRLNQLRGQREFLGDPPKERSAHELHAQHPDARSEATRVRMADKQLLDARRAEAALDTRPEPASPAERAEARERTEQAEQHAGVQRERLKSAVTKEVKMDVERAMADAKEAKVDYEQRAKKLDQEIRVVERETAARSVATQLVKEGVKARLGDDTDAPRAFVVREVREVLDGRQKVALLEAADGSVVVAPVTGHKNADDLREGDLVAFNGPERRYLVNPYREDHRQAKQTLAELRPFAQERAAKVFDVLKDHDQLGPEARQLAELADRYQKVAHRHSGPAYRMADQLRQGEQRLWALVQAEGPEAEREAAQALAECMRQRQTVLQQQRAAKAQLQRGRDRADSIRLRHALNQGRPEGSRVRMMPWDERTYELEQFIERGRRTYLLARSADGAQYLVHASRNHEFREGAERGLLFQRTHKGLAPASQHQERFEMTRQQSRAMQAHTLERHR